MRRLRKPPTFDDICPDLMREYRNTVEKQAKAKGESEFIQYERRARAIADAIHDTYDDYMNRFCRLKHPLFHDLDLY